MFTLKSWKSHIFSGCWWNSQKRVFSVLDMLRMSEIHPKQEHFAKTIFFCTTSLRIPNQYMGQQFRIQCTWSIRLNTYMYSWNQWSQSWGMDWHLDICYIKQQNVNYCQNVGKSSVLSNFSKYTTIWLLITYSVSSSLKISQSYNWNTKEAHPLREINSKKILPSKKQMECIISNWLTKTLIILF